MKRVEIVTFYKQALMYVQTQAKILDPNIYQIILDEEEEETRLGNFYELPITCSPRAVRPVRYLMFTAQQADAATLDEFVRGVKERGRFRLASLDDDFIYDYVIDASSLYPGYGVQLDGMEIMGQDFVNRRNLEAYIGNVHQTIECFVNMDEYWEGRWTAEVFLLSEDEGPLEAIFNNQVGLNLVVGEPAW